jgi:hypothetical protein
MKSSKPSERDLRLPPHIRRIEKTMSGSEEEAPPPLPPRRPLPNGLQGIELQRMTPPPSADGSFHNQAQLALNGDVQPGETDYSPSAPQMVQPQHVSQQGQQPGRPPGTSSPVSGGQYPHGQPAAATQLQGPLHPIHSSMTASYPSHHSYMPVGADEGTASQPIGSPSQQSYVLADGSIVYPGGSYTGQPTVGGPPTVNTGSFTNQTYQSVG